MWKEAEAFSQMVKYSMFVASERIYTRKESTSGRGDRIADNHLNCPYTGFPGSYTMQMAFWMTAVLFKSSREKLP